MLEWPQVDCFLIFILIYTWDGQHCHLVFFNILGFSQLGKLKNWNIYLFMLL